jgi:hypothetical protein
MGAEVAFSSSVDSTGSFATAGAGVGVGSTGVSGGESLTFGFAASRFFSSVFKKTLMVVRRDL